MSYPPEEPLGILMWAHDVGMRIKFNDGKLHLSGNRRYTTLISALRDARGEITEFLTGLEDRMRRGQQWLIRADQRLWDKPLRKSRKLIDIFDANLILWDDLDKLVYPRRCPIGENGCDPASLVLCRTCGR
jgi:hypothetical protein